MRGFLGEKTAAKAEIVDRLLTAHRSSADVPHAIMELALNLRANDEGGLPAGCFKCPSGQSSDHFCKCLQPMLVDSILLHAGRTERETARADYRRYLEKCVLLYCLAVNAWLVGGGGDALSAVEFHIIPAHLARATALRIRALLGDRNPEKIWLAACLLKTVAGNQRWRKGGERIDSVPGATSWFRQSPSGTND